MGNKDIKLIDSKGLRVDGRKPDELRPLKMEVSVFSRPDGSAYVEQGKNKVYAAVYGPREIHPRHLSIADRSRIRVQYRMATFSVPDRKRPAPSRREIEISKVIREALEPVVFVEKFPKTGIDLFIEVVQADGGTRCASINAAVLALADSGIPLRDLPVACAVGKVDDTMVLDLNDVEDQNGDADIPMAYIPRDEKFTLFQMDGRLTKKEFLEAIKLFKKGAKEIVAKQKEALRKKYLDVRKEVEKSKTKPKKAEKAEVKKETKKKKKTEKKPKKVAKEEKKK